MYLPSVFASRTWAVGSSSTAQRAFALRKSADRSVPSMTTLNLSTWVGIVTHHEDGSGQVACGVPAGGRSYRLKPPTIGW